MPKPKISFIFVNYRSAHLLIEALASLESIEAYCEAEKIIVNNDQTERTLVDSLSHGRERVKIVHRENNEGFGRANNHGVRYAEGEILFFLNPDARWRSGNVENFLKIFQENPKTLLGPALEDAVGRREKWSSGPLPSLRALLVTNLFGWLTPRPWKTKSPLETGWISGAAMVLRKDFFESLGGFDEDYFLYFEDVDLSARVKRAGGRVMISPDVVLRHIGGQSHQSERAKKEAYLRGQRIFFSKWRPKYETRIIVCLQRMLTSLA